MRNLLFVATALSSTFVAARPDATANSESPERHLVEQRQSCAGPVAGNATSWWRAEIGHNGTTPYSTDTSFEYYRTVVQYGADSTGQNDSSDAFNWAITAWNRTANTVTTRPAYVYVPPGTYLIKSPIQMLVSTYLVGDPLDPPTLVADPALDNHTIINGYDSHQGDGSATKNFYMTVRNINLDTTRIDRGTTAHAMDWSVSQGCSLTNVNFTMAPDSNHIGITMNQGGSGTVIADCNFSGGKIGLQLMNQQYMLKGLNFNGCNTGIFFGNSFVTTIQDSSFRNCSYGVDMGRSGSAGTVSIVDSSSSCSSAGVTAYVSGNGDGSLILDNFDMAGGPAVVNAEGGTLLSGSVPLGQTWVMGNEDPQKYQSGKSYPIDRPSGLVSNDKYFTMPLPQYEQYDVSQVASVKLDPDYTVYGDNVHDDGPAINAILRKYAGCKIVFFPQGIYRTNETIYVPPGSRVVGEVLSVISGVGSNFTNVDTPQPIVKVGNPGEKGVAQFTDMLFSTADILPGAIIVEVNMAGNNPGDVGFWTCVIRVGGSVDSLVTHNCGGRDPSKCKAAFALLHITKTASVYLEDVWGWVADHALDPDLPGQNIAVGRGALIESTAPTWLVGTAFEHSVMYQYALNNAQNVYIGMQQTESPYWQGQGTPQLAPAPWAVDPDYGDPTFSNCAAQNASSSPLCLRAWGQYMNGSSDIVIHGSALWVFYNGMDDNKFENAGCTDSNGTCQTNMAFVDAANATFWYSASGKSAMNLVYDVTGGSAVVATQDANQGSWGAVVAAYLRDSGIASADSSSGGGMGLGGIDRRWAVAAGMLTALGVAMF